MTDLEGFGDLPAWYAAAACLGVPDRLGRDPWFVEGQGAQPAEAIAVCEQCPVRQPCAAYAIEQGITEGVWGGLTPKQRRQHRAA